MKLAFFDRFDAEFLLQLKDDHVRRMEIVRLSRIRVVLFWVIMFFAALFFWETFCEPWDKAGTGIILLLEIQAFCEVQTRLRLLKAAEQS